MIQNFSLWPADRTPVQSAVSRTRCDEAESRVLSSVKGHFRLERAVLGAFWDDGGRWMRDWNWNGTLRVYGFSAG
jgi:hypothetical protein